MSETRIVKEVRVEASVLGARLFRNNVGKLPDRAGRWVEFGLCKGSGDLIGTTPVEITPEMVGQVLGVFTSVECKDFDGMDESAQRDFLVRAIASGSPLSKNASHIQDQLRWIDMVRRMGGIAGVALDKSHLRSILKR